MIHVLKLFPSGALRLSSAGFCVIYLFSMKKDLSKVREEGGGGKSSVLQLHRIKLHQALH